MSKELVVSSNQHETRLAILENDQLVEIYIERGAQLGMAGSIYKGRVSRVLPGMQSAFVKIGLDRDAFLYVSDVVDAAAEAERVFEDPSSESDDAGLTAHPLPVRSAPEAVEAPRPEPREEEQPTGGRHGRHERRNRRGGRRRRGRGPRSGGERHAREEEKNPEPASGRERDRDRGAPAAAEPREEPERPAEAAEAEALTMLPGESLAKYASPRPAGRKEPEAAPRSESGKEAARQSRGDSTTKANHSEDQNEQEEESKKGLFSWMRRRRRLPRGNPSSAPDSQRDAEPGRGREEAPPSDPPANPEPQTQARSHAAGEDQKPGQPAASEEPEHPAASGHGGEHPAPGMPEPRPEDSDEPERPAQQASVREGSDSPRHLRRRGRRGRRRGGRGRSPRVESGHEAAPEANGAPDAPAPAADGQTRISDLLQPGQEIIVQIAKEPLGRKGARITAHVALPGRFLVYMPTVNHAGVSRKIQTDAERQRLRQIIQAHRTGMPGGFIVRTAGQGASDEDIRGDMLFLYNLWLDICAKAESRPAPALLHQDLDIVERTLRDQLGHEFKTIWVDNEEEYERILRFVERFQPDLIERVKLYTRPTPIFEEFNIDAEIEKALRPKVWLKSGGYIVINQTEALVAIDVNTGKYVGKSDRLEDTIVKTNLEAVQEIVRQVRLRDLGGIIVVDFIDMDDRSNRQKVRQALERELSYDRAPSKALAFNDFGLIAITRKRVKQSLERALCSPCPYCSGSGNVKAAPTVIFEILSQARKIAPKLRGQKDVLLRCSPDVARLLKSRDNAYLQELEDTLRANVVVRSDVALHRENFDLN